MSMEEPETNPGRRPRVGESGAPVGSVLSIVLAVVAVIIGFVILREIDDDGTAGGAGNGASENGDNGDNGDDGDDGDNGDGDDGPDSTTTSSAPAGPTNVFKGARVVVVNSNETGGSARTMSDKLEAVGFTMGDPKTGADDIERLERSRLLIKPNPRARAVAETVARSFGTNIPIREGVDITVQEESPADGGVLFLVGTDLVEADPSKPSGGNVTPPESGD